MLASFVSRFYLLPVVAVLGMAVLALLALPVGATQTEIQKLADEAALAGVTALGTSDAQAEAAKRDEAIKAAQKVLSGSHGIEGKIAASPEALTVTVTLATPATKQVLASSTAHYTPAEQPADWAWASRQNFALKRTPVVVGANCSPGCEADTLR